jgi:hypothetical protein
MSWVILRFCTKIVRWCMRGRDGAKKRQGE